MKLLIDGYNLIKFRMQKDRITDAELRAFLKSLGHYCQTKNLAATIVLDGGVFGFTCSEKQYGLNIIYTGYKSTADDFIKQHLTLYAKQVELLVVSSDREIVNFVKHHPPATSIKSSEFNTILDHFIKSNMASDKLSYGELNKTTASMNDELDQLMELHTLDMQITISKESVSDKIDKVKFARQSSKKERQFNKKLKKL